MRQAFTKPVYHKTKFKDNTTLTQVWKYTRVPLTLISLLLSPETNIFAFGMAMISVIYQNNFIIKNELRMWRATIIKRKCCNGGSAY